MKISALAILFLAATSGALSGQVTNSVPPPSSLEYHLATNAAARAVGRRDMLAFESPNFLGLNRLAQARWSETCWLRGVRGLCATPIGFANVPGGQGLPTMVSPRHYLCSTHMHPESYLVAFLDTDNFIHWRCTVQRVDVGGDTSVGLLDADLPPSVGFLPVLPADFTNYLSFAPPNLVQGIGMNQDFFLFSQPMHLAGGGGVSWDPSQTVTNGPPKAWNVVVRGGDSSNPEMLLIGNQLVLVSHNYTARYGPSYVAQTPDINAKMHLLSTNHHLKSDYQLTVFPLTNWPVIR